LSWRQAVTVSVYSHIRATSQQDISRSRLWFFEGKKKILLYSERSHFYHRYKVIRRKKNAWSLWFLLFLCYLYCLGYSLLSFCHADQGNKAFANLFIAREKRILSRGID
jgi:hypothetical protein